MKNFLLKFLCIFTIAGFCSFAPANSFAADSNGITNVGNYPGTNKTILQMQSTRAKGRQLRDKAISLEVLRKPESVTDLVCLPKLSANLSGLGLAFTDIKDIFSFELSPEALCSIIGGVQGGLGAKLSMLLKIASTGLLGLNLPVLELCTGELSLGFAIPISLGLNGGLLSGGSFKVFGCAINANIGIYANIGLSGAAGAGIGIPSYCVDFKLPIFECTSLGDFLNGPSNKHRFIPINKLGKILPAQGGGANGGVAYVTTDEQTTLALGGDYNLLRALGMGDINPAVSAIAGFQLGFTLEGSLATEWNSKDGLSSDDGVALGFGSGIMAGTGYSWKDVHQSNYSKEVNKTLMSDEERMRRGPGSIINITTDDMEQSSLTNGNENNAGTAVWKVSPTVGAAVEAHGVLDLMKLAKKIDPTSN